MTVGPSSALRTGSQRPGARAEGLRGEGPGGFTGDPRTLPEVVTAVGDVAGCTFLTDEEVSALAVAVGGPAEGDDEPQPRAGALDATVRYGVDLADLARRASFRGAAGTVHTVELPRAHDGRGASLPWAGLPLKIVLVGTGRGTATDLRRAGAALARATTGDERVVSAVSSEASDQAARAFVEGYLLASYQPVTLRRAAGPRPPAEQLVLLGGAASDQAARRAVQEAGVAVAATWFARDLTTAPPDVATPRWLAGRAVALAEAEGLDVEVRDVDRLARDGFGGILTVGGGSANEPRLVVVSSQPFAGAAGPRADRSARHVVIVGKGITFDSGGLQVKPRTSMPAMKTDMAGAAVALATVWAAARLGTRTQVTAVLPLAENAFSGSAYRPSDVVTLVDGTTVETGDTDAEGRLVLADAMAYAVAHLAPDVLIDVATLTGAATLSLGRTHAPLFATDETLASAIEAAAARTGEDVWRMPLVADYAGATASRVADVRQVPDADHAVGAGAIVAATFLRRFAGDVPWAHLDIAGTARSPKARHEVAEGATGFGVRLLLETVAGL